MIPFITKCIDVAIYLLVKLSSARLIEAESRLLGCGHRLSGYQVIVYELGISMTGCLVLGRDVVSG